MPREITAPQVAELIAKGATLLLLDVRHEWEHARCALPGSTLIPLPELAERVSEVTPPAGALVVAYCHHGVRSLSAAAILEAAGVPRVVSMAGGIDAWSLLVDPKVPRY